MPSVRNTGTTQLWIIRKYVVRPTMILEEIKRVLKPSGLLLFRVNSVRDVNHGAGEGKEIEPHLYETSDGRYKRFFDQSDIERFFAEWEKFYVHEETMGRYEKEKILWRCAMQVKK